MAGFFIKSNENTYTNGRALMQMYRVVPQSKRRNSQCKPLLLFSDNIGLDLRITLTFVNVL